MPVTDLSYARGRKPEERLVLGLEVKGWHLGWAVHSPEAPVAWGTFGAKDHVDGKPVPPSTKIAGVFASLIELAVERKVTQVVTSSGSHTGPMWAVAPLVAVTVNARYGELRDWEEELGVDRKRLRAWATVAAGAVLENDMVVTALGLAAVGAKAIARETGARWPGEEE